MALRSVQFDRFVKLLSIRKEQFTFNYQHLLAFTNRKEALVLIVEINISVISFTLFVWVSTVLLSYKPYSSWHVNSCVLVPTSLWSLSRQGQFQPRFDTEARLHFTQLQKFNGLLQRSPYIIWEFTETTCCINKCEARNGDAYVSKYKLVSTSLFSFA